jgi:hypothetical protein
MDGNGIDVSPVLYFWHWCVTNSAFYDRPIFIAFNGINIRANLPLFMAEPVAEVLKF